MKKRPSWVRGTLIGKRGLEKKKGPPWAKNGSCEKVGPTRKKKSFRSRGLFMEKRGFHGKLGLSWN